MNLRRIGAALLLTGLALAGTATPALAHTELKSSNPSAGAELPAAPQRIELTFGEAVTLPDNPVTVTGPDGSHWTVGQVTVADAVVTAPVQPVGPAGQYTIDYKVIADDGEEVGGTVRFSLTTAATPVTASTPPASSSTAPTTTTASSAPATQQASDSTDNSGGGVPVWVWIIAAIVLVGAGALVALRLGRSKPSE